MELEWKTRRDRIDKRLPDLGWKIVPFAPSLDTTKLRHHAVTEFETADGPADYALFVDGRLLGVVEAKRLSLGPRNVLTQAERYSKGATDSGMDFRGYHVPFLYSTNGEVLWFHDIRDKLNVSRRVTQFHTPAAMSEMLTRGFDAECAALAALPNAHPRLRYYQIECNAATERAIADRKRQMLLAMATGTGKTFTMVNQTYRLMKSGVGRRVLFLVDRRALAAQAVRSFAAFEPEPGLKFPSIYEVYSQRFQKDDLGDEEKFDPKLLPKAYLETPQAKHAFVYICTIQRMAINLFGRGAAFGGEDAEEIDDDDDQLKIPIHAFDIIIADECHRGYTTAEEAIWRQTLDHFDAIKIGLTATPAAHTKAYFRDVAYRYTYSQAVSDGYLVDYDQVNIQSDVRMQGVFLREGERVTRIDPESGVERLDEVEDERQFEATDVERLVTSPDSNRKILEEVKRYAAEHEERTGRFPKTLIFAHNDRSHTSHADELLKLAVDIFGRGESFVRKITGKVDRPLQRIREFRNRPEPGIVISVDLMSTGVDIPDLEYIVFLRPVKSRILFEQMLGRGTRKGEKFPDKSHFVVFDCFGGSLVQYFKDATAITADPPEKAPRSIREVIDDIWSNRDRDYNVRCLVKRLQRIAKEMDGTAIALFQAQGVPEGDLARFAAELPKALKADFTGLMSLLRKESMLALLENYPRAKAVFYRADQAEDTVASEYLPRDGAGKAMKPEDYLEAFAEFVRGNEAQVEAIAILLNRPAGWNPAALKELRQRLMAAPQRFTLETLQRVHDRCYHKALADIISMVKHAARESEPLLTAHERVSRAMARITAGKTFTPEQQAWLERIRTHLLENLSIDRGDFEYVPVLSGPGGWVPADRAFGGTLAVMVKSLNEALAA